MIGEYVKQFESGDKGSLSFSSCGNDWGLSCGSYQLTLRWGNCIKFLKQFFPKEAINLYFYNIKDFASKKWPGEFYCSSPDEVKEIWIQCYNKVGKNQFYIYEHNYIEDICYKPIKQKINGYINLDTANRAFQECFWSWSIHRGVNGCYKEFIEAVSKYNIRQLSQEQLFDILYDVRYKYFPYNRYKKGNSTSEREILRPLLQEQLKMKYNKKNKPIQCMQTNSTCYKRTRKMEVLGVLWHSTGANNPYLKRYVQPSENDSNYIEMINLLGKNLSGNDWNHIERQAGLNAWIGKTKDNKVITIQTMPWDYRPWGCGSGPKGSCNTGWVQFEICEDQLSDRNYFNQVYKEACELTAYICKLYNINPQGTITRNGVKIPTILCHKDSHDLGFGSNHGDVLHWFKKYNKTMEDVRNDVAKILESEEDEEMTQEQFNKMMDQYLVERSMLEPEDWSEPDRKWCEENELIKGDKSGNKMYKKFLTREEMAALLFRLYKLIKK